MKPLIHAKNSVKKYGGKPEDYLEIHNFFDSSKSCVPDMRHRAIFHSAFGVFLIERIFGVYITNSDGKDVSVRDIAEDHVIDDLGFVPTMEKWFETLQLQEWMMGSLRGVTRPPTWDFSTSVILNIPPDLCDRNRLID